jgi:hypothetical protein
VSPEKQINLNSESQKIINKTRTDVEKIFLGKALLKVFDEFTDPSTIVITKKVFSKPAINNEYWHCIFADYKTKIINFR